jgi:mRNA interferase RelE/StbE
VTDQPYEIAVTRTARKALTERLPFDVVVGASELMHGALSENPHRLGKELEPPYNGIYSARLMREWRILYVIDDKQHRVTIRDIRHRRDAYHT